MNYRAIAETIFIKELITKTYPIGFVSLVADSFDFFRVLTYSLPKLKTEIMARDGKVVIRPDSGDPVDIICGNAGNSTQMLMLQGIKEEDKHWKTDKANDLINKLKNIPEQKGAIELLWEVFGGTTNEKGYKVLDSHIGLIYGDSITIERAQEIFRRLEAKGFASSNVVFGVGSYTYCYNTRDSQGWAMKATWCQVNGEGREIFKEPITDSGKKSAKGLMRVNEDGTLTDCCTKEQEEWGLLQTKFLNGDMINVTTLATIRKKLQ